LTEEAVIESDTRPGKIPAIIRRIGAISCRKYWVFVTRFGAAKVPEDKIDDFCPAGEPISRCDPIISGMTEFNIWFTFIALPCLKSRKT